MVPKIEIPVIDRYVIQTPQINVPTVPVTVPLGFPIIQMPCVETRRFSYENSALINNDPAGNVVLCDANMPSFTPMEFTPDEFIYTESDLKQDQAEDEVLQGDTPEIPTDTEEDEIFFIDCPGPKDQRVGDFRNEKRLETVKGHELSEDGKECITLYEPVTFVEQYLPSAATASTVAASALVAATVPLLVPVIKNGVKILVKKLTSRKKKE